MRLPAVVPDREHANETVLRWLIECKTAFINGFGGSAAKRRATSFAATTIPASYATNPAHRVAQSPAIPPPRAPVLEPGSAATTPILERSPDAT